MKTAFICQPIDGKIPPPRNSIGIIIYELARAMARKEGTEVSVFCVGDRWKGGTVEDEGVTYHHLPAYADLYAKKAIRKIRKRFGDPFKPFYASAWSYPAYAWQLAAEIRRLEIEVVHMINFSQFIPLIRKLNPEVKIVIHMECEWLSQLSPELIEPRLEKTDLILGCAGYLTKRIQERYPQFKEKCNTLYNGIDVSRFAGQALEPDRLEAKAKDSDRESKILFVGRVSPEKGVHVLLDAMARVVKSRPNTRLEFIGGVGNVPKEYVMDISDDPLVKDLARFYDERGQSLYKAHLEKQLETYDLKDRVDFVGFVPNSQLQERLLEADLLVFPSVWEEPFGIPPVEAMAMGLPVVVSRSGGMAETVLHEKTGLVVERNDPKDLAQAILRLLEDPALRVELGKAALEWTHQTFSYAVLATQLHDHFKRLLETRA